MDSKLLVLLFLTTMIVASLSIPLEKKKRQVTKDPACLHALYPMLCADKKGCIKESQVCDGIKTCADNSDEENCDGNGNGDNGGGDNGNGGGDNGNGDGGGNGDQDTGNGDCNTGAKTQGSCSNPTGEATCNTGLDDLRQQMLNSHNYYRCLHGLTGDGQMTLSAELNNYAQQWADHLANTDTSAHSANRGQNPPDRGENIWTGSDASRWTEFEQFTGEAPVGDWYSEISNYNWQTYTGNGNSMVGHFTQVVWKGSTELGCGVGRGERPWGPKFYVVCQYRQAGNIAAPSENVPPLV